MEIGHNTSEKLNLMVHFDLSRLPRQNIENSQSYGSECVTENLTNVQPLWDRIFSRFSLRFLQIPFGFSDETFDRPLVRSATLGSVHRSRTIARRNRRGERSVGWGNERASVPSK